MKVKLGQTPVAVLKYQKTNNKYQINPKIKIQKGETS
jgi:hypothetical protein